MVVALRQAHNHGVMAGESLRHRPVSAGTRQLFQAMFDAGMTPPQALALHQSNLHAEHGDLYQKVTFMLLCLHYFIVVLEKIESQFAISITSFWFASLCFLI